MSIRHRAARAGLAAALAAGSVLVLAHQGPTPSESIELDALRWRPLGPMVGGETTGVAGHAADPRRLYASSPGGGLWTTTDYGQSWQPLFDDQTTGVVTAVAVAPSDARRLFAGTGPAPGGRDQPDSATLFTSTDAGTTWARTGFQTHGTITRIVAHPTNPNALLITLLSPAGPDSAAGIYRSSDGGRTFDRVLAGSAATRRLEIAIDPREPSIVYAAQEQESDASGVFRSTDAGATWQPISGLPGALTDGLGATSLAVSPARAGLVFANVSARSRGGLYRSDDQGQTWSLVSNDARLEGAALAADPANVDILYAAGTAALRSTDGGRTWTSWRAGTGVSYRAVWIHPTEPGLAALASSAGVFVTVNGGGTWSSGGPPTAAFTQVIADQSFPYRVCGGQPDGRVACMSSRGGTIAEWLGGPLNRTGYVAIDSTDPDLLYLGELGRYDRRSGQWLDISPPGRPRSSPAAAAPLLFPAANPRALYFAGGGLWTSSNGGQQWTQFGPELAEAPAATAAGEGTGAISALSVSAIDSRVLWIGTDRGRVHVTRDRGATWTEVTPPALSGTSAAVRRVEASYFDTSTVYVVLAEHRTGRSMLMRTRTGGATWVDLSGGLPADAIHVVREDSGRRGLLYAAGDRSVWLSFDDGESWQTLRLNLPPAPVRDLQVKDADLIAATAGRGLWVLDDITPLRQITPDVWRAPAFLFRPPPAWRTRAIATGRGSGATPHGHTAPEGVAITYRLGQDASALAIEIVDGPAGDLVRRYAPGSPEAPPATEGLHRLIWDVRHTPPAVEWIEGIDPASIPGRWALPATYQIRLLRSTSPLRQAVLVRLDPRVRASAADLTLQSTLTRGVEDRLAALAERDASLRQRQTALLPGPGTSSAATDLRAQLQAAGRRLVDLFLVLQSADARPTAATEAAVQEALGEVDRLVEQTK